MPIKQKNRILWWQYPSFSDAPIGPWSIDIPRIDEEPLHHWERAINWMADNGVNIFIGNLGSYVKEMMRYSNCGDWPFGLICEWPEFPNAQLFSNYYLKTMRQVTNYLIELFHQRGIRVFLHHYNHFLPYQWFIRQPSLVERKRDSNNLIPDFSPYNQTLIVKSVCPNAPEYRKFMQASWQELFQHLPDLDGLLITLGESNWCPCRECTGGVPIDGKWQHAIRYEQLETMRKFADLYVETIQSLGKEPLLRTWHGGGDEEISKSMPKGPIYLIKYSGFNSIDCNPDPIYRYWENAGHRLWVVHEVSGAEPGGPCTWLNPKWVSQVNARATKQMNIEGSVVFHNNYQGRIDQVFPSTFFNMEAALQFFQGISYDKAYWEKRASDLLGPNGGTYLKASELYSQIILNIDKVVGSPEDGIAFSWNVHFVGDKTSSWPGVVGEFGAKGTEPHPWVRENIGVLRHYKRYLEDHPWTKNIAEKAIPIGYIDPLVFIKEKWELALEGVKIIEKIPHGNDGPYATIHRIFLLSARWAAELGRFWYSLLRAKVFWWGANSLCSDIATQKELAQKCLTDLDEVINAVWQMQSFFYEFPFSYMCWGRALSNRTLEEKLSHFRKIRDEVAQHFAPLLEDKVFKWPTIVHFTWPDKKNISQRVPLSPPKKAFNTIHSSIASTTRNTELK